MAVNYKVYCGVRDNGRREAQAAGGEAEEGGSGMDEADARGDWVLISWSPQQSWMYE